MPLVSTRGAASAQGFGEFAQAAVVPQYIEEVFSTYLYTGTGATQSITNNIDVTGKGALVWLKRRNSTNDHFLFDTARGVGTGSQALSSNTTAAGGAGADIAFSSTGFDLTQTGSNTNGSGATYASWTWRKQAKFFDIQTWTGSGANRTIAHSLGSVPACIMVKRTDTTGDWQVYHRSLANTEYLVLNSTAAKATGATRWNSTTPTSSVFSLGTDATVNASAGTYVAYIFAHDAGGFGLTGTDNVISCGTFTGLATVNLGYEPQWIMYKTSGSANSGWLMVDNMRGFTSGSADPYLEANSSAAESGGNDLLTITSTGFTNNLFSSDTFIYIAIRRGPMKVPTTGTSVYQGNTYTGNATANTTVAGNFGFPVDLMLLSSRSANSTSWNSYAQIVFDRLRGSSNSVQTSRTVAEISGWETYNAFDVQNSIGWGLYGVDSNTAFLNNSGGTWVANGFRRAPSFMDICAYLGTGSNTTQTHNLGVVPELILVKCRSAAIGWAVYVSALGNTGYLELNTTGGDAGPVPTAWNSTTPTSTVFSLGSNPGTNYAANTMVAYLFATCAGVSKVGSYTGNGSTQTINCGFGAGGARFVMIKRTDSTGNWYIYDTARGMTTLTDPYLFLNTSAAEVATLGSVTTVSTGFALNSAILAAINVNAGTYIFLAIA